MKTSLLLLLICVAAGCARREALLFQTVERRHLGEQKPPAQTVFASGEFPVFYAASARLTGQELFVELYNERGVLVDISPNWKATGTGGWIRPRPKPPGKYHARLNLNGDFVAELDFTILK